MISTPDDLHRFETTVRKPKGDGKIDAPNSRFASSPPLSLSLSLSLRVANLLHSSQLF